MSLAFVSLVSLFVAIVLSSLARLNVGVIALGFAWLIGIYLAGMEVKTIVASFPLSLATVLFGVTLLFAQAQQNGTLAALTARGLVLVRGRRALLPPLFFLLALLVASIGPGNIAAVALVAPMAMAVAGKARISAFLMTLMVANGANAGAFSPFAPTGIVANGLIAAQGLPMNPWTQVYLPSLIAQSVVALLGYVVFGGLRLWQAQCPATDCVSPLPSAVAPLTRSQWLTVGAIVGLIGGVVVFGADTGFLALTLAALLAVLGAADQKQALKLVPWDTIVMVCGVSTLIAILGSTGGLDLFTRWLAALATPNNVTGVIALIAGLLSVYSSSSGVVMPAFIPLVPGLIAQLGGGDPVAIIAAINVGSHVVDVSPLSTLGAICLANAASHEDRPRLFRSLFYYGLAMSVVGALVCYVSFGRW